MNIVKSIHISYKTAVAETTSTSPNDDEEQTVLPTTPTSTGQPNCGSISTKEVVKSPFNFEVHSDMILQLTKSPGDGFLFHNRPMFDHSSVDPENNQVLNLYNLTSVCTSSILLSTLFLGCWPGEFVSQSRTFLVGDHFCYSHDLKWMIQQYNCQEKLDAGHS